MASRHCLGLAHQCIQQSLCTGLVYVHCRFQAGASHMAFFRRTLVEAIPSKQVQGCSIRCPSERLNRDERLVCPRNSVSKIRDCL